MQCVPGRLPVCSAIGRVFPATVGVLDTFNHDAERRALWVALRPSRIEDALDGRTVTVRLVLRDARERAPVVRYRRAFIDVGDRHLDNLSGGVTRVVSRRDLKLVNVVAVSVVRILEVFRGVEADLAGFLIDAEPVGVVSGDQVCDVLIGGVVAVARVVDSIDVEYRAGVPFFDVGSRTRLEPGVVGVVNDIGFIAVHRGFVEGVVSIVDDVAVSVVDVKAEFALAGPERDGDVVLTRRDCRDGVDARVDVSRHLGEREVVGTDIVDRFGERNSKPEFVFVRRRFSRRLTDDRLDPRSGINLDSPLGVQLDVWTVREAAVLNNGTINRVTWVIFFVVPRAVFLYLGIIFSNELNGSNSIIWLTIRPECRLCTTNARDVKEASFRSLRNPMPYTFTLPRYVHVISGPDPRLRLNQTRDMIVLRFRGYRGEISIKAVESIPSCLISRMLPRIISIVCIIIEFVFLPVVFRFDAERHFSGRSGRFWCSVFVLNRLEYLLKLTGCFSTCSRKCQFTGFLVVVPGDLIVNALIPRENVRIRIKSVFYLYTRTRDRVNLIIDNNGIINADCIPILKKH